MVEEGGGEAEGEDDEGTDGGLEQGCKADPHFVFWKPNSGTLFPSIVMDNFSYF